MANVENRAAEHGSVILTGPVTRAFGTGRLPCAMRVLTDAVITSITSPNTEGIDFYDGVTLAVEDPIVLASISEVVVESGTVQLVYS